MNNRKQWSQDEDIAVLAQVYSDQELAAKFGRSISSIKARRDYLKSSANTRNKRKAYYWSEEETALLLSGIYSDEELSGRLGRSVPSIQQRRYRLRGIFSRAKNYWPLEHDKLVIDQSIPDIEIARLTDRTESEIIRRRSILQNNTTQHRRWTEEEEQLIITSDMSDKELSAIILRSVDSIQRRRSKLLGKCQQQDNHCKHKTRDEMAYKYPRRRWTSDEIQLAMDHSIPDSELALRLNRSISSIQDKRLYERRKARRESK